MKSIPSYLSQIVLIVILYCILVCLQLKDFSDDPGVGWHLKTGEIILTEFKIPRIDPFLASQQPREWVSDQWLSDLVLEKAYDIGGFPLIYAICITIFIFIFGGILYSSLLFNKINPIFGIISVVLAIKFASIHFILRPVVFSFLLFSISSTLIAKFHISNFKDLKGLWALPIIFLFWANMHPSFIIGLTLLTISIVSIIIDKFFFDKEIESRITNLSIFLLISCFVATLINPYFFDLHKSILALSESKYFMNLHNEWLPMDIRDDVGGLFYAILFSIFLLMFFVRGREIKISTFSFLTFLFLAFMSVKSVRFAPYFGITFSLIFCELLNSFFVRIKDNLLVNTSYFKGWILPTLFGLLLISYNLITHDIPLIQDKFGPSTKEYPYQAITELRKLTQDKTTSVLSHPNWGGFIVWKSDMKLKPILDDRNTLVGEVFHKEVMKALESRQSAIEYARANGIKYILYRNKEIKEKEKLDVVEGTVFKDDVSTIIEVK